MLLEIGKGQATTIVIVIAGVIEFLLLLALLRNLSRKSKEREQGMNMYDNTPTNQTYDYTYQNSSPQVEQPVFNDNMNQDINSFAPMDSITSAEYNQDMYMSDNQDSVFSGENLMNMQNNDTLDVPNTMNYDNSSTETSVDNYNDVTTSSSLESLDNLPDIISDNNDSIPINEDLNNGSSELTEPFYNNDPLPTLDELGSNPNEIVEPIENDNNIDNEINMENSDDNMNISLDNSISDINYDIPADNSYYNNDISNTDIGFDNSVPNDYDIPIESNPDQLEVPYNEDI